MTIQTKNSMANTQPSSRSRSLSLLSLSFGDFLSASSSALESPLDDSSSVTTEYVGDIVKCTVYSKIRKLTVGTDGRFFATDVCTNFKVT